MQKRKDQEKFHEPVLLNEVVEAFKFVGNAHLKKGTKIIDATLGLGGHTEALVKNGADVLGIDADNEMLKLAKKRLDLACPTPKSDSWGSYDLVYGNFRNINDIAKKANFYPVDGVLYDLGVSSPQITSALRGISFRSATAPLDMRVDKESSGVTGSDLLNSLREDQLFHLFVNVLKPKDARSLSREVIRARLIKNITTVSDFVEIISRSVRIKKRLNIATLPFLALRMAVNSEIENLEESLPKSLEILARGGKLVVISFHSGEDRVVDRVFKGFADSNLGTVITKNPIIPSPEEIGMNIRSRSAKMRIFEKNE